MRPAIPNWLSTIGLGVAGLAGLVVFRGNPFSISQSVHVRWDLPYPLNTPLFVSFLCGVLIVWGASEYFE